MHFYTKHVQISWKRKVVVFLSSCSFCVPPISGQFLLSCNKPVHVIWHFVSHLRGLDVDDELASMSCRPQVVSFHGMRHESEDDFGKCAERFLDSIPPLFAYDLHDIFTAHKTSA